MVPIVARHITNKLKVHGASGQHKDLMPDQPSQPPADSAAETAPAAKTDPARLPHPPVVCLGLAETAKADGQVKPGSRSPTAPIAAVSSDAWRDTVPIPCLNRSTARGCSLTGTTAKSTAQAPTPTAAPSVVPPAQADSRATARSGEAACGAQAVGQAGSWAHKRVKQHSEMVVAAQASAAPPFRTEPHMKSQLVICPYRSC